MKQLHSGWHCYGSQLLSTHAHSAALSPSTGCQQFNCAQAHSCNADMGCPAERGISGSAAPHALLHSA